MPGRGEFKERLVPKSLLEKVPFFFKAELGFALVLATVVDQADPGANFQIGGVEALAVGTIEGIGDTKNTGEKVEVFFAGLGKIGVTTMGGRGDAFAMVACEEGNEIGLGAGEVWPSVRTDEASRFFVVGAFGGGGGPTDIVEEGAGDKEIEGGGRELVQGGKFFEKENRPEGDVTDVVGLLLEAGHEGGGLADEGRGRNHRQIFRMGRGARESSQTP